MPDIFTSVLDSAHLIPKSAKGSDDPRIGLVLCATRNRVFEAGFFGIHPETMSLHFHENGLSANELYIQHESLNHLRNIPHKDALSWLWDNIFRQ